MNLFISLLIVSTICLVAGAPAPQQLGKRNEKQVVQTGEEDLPSKGATIEEVVVESALYIKSKPNQQQVRRVRSADFEDSLRRVYETHKRVKRQFAEGFGGNPEFGADGFGGPNFGGGFGGNQGFGGYQGFGGNPGFGGNRRHGGGQTQAGTSAGVGGTKAGVDVGAGPDGGTANANVELNPLGPLGPNGYNQEQAASNGAAHSNYNNGFDSGSSASNAQAQGFQSESANSSFGASSASTATQAQNSNPFGNSNSAGASLSQVYHLPNGQTINFSSSNSFANGGAAHGNSHGASVSVSR